MPILSALSFGSRGYGFIGALPGPPPVGQEVFTTLGTQTWTVPSGVTQISAVCVGGGGGGSASTLSSNGVSGGGGGGGGLHWRTFTVTPGETLTIEVGSGGSGGTAAGSNNASSGGESSIKRGLDYLIRAGGGSAGLYNATTGYTPGGATYYTTLGGGGGTGGQGGCGSNGNTGGGGGGASGYSGNGGDGSQGTSYNETAGQGGGGGGGTGANSLATPVTFGGGGVGLLGEGTSGAANLTTFNQQGNPGSGGNGLQYGGGGSGAEDDSPSSGGNGGQGAVRIIWGEGRSYPSTGTDDQVTASVTPTTTNVNEGSSVTFNVTTSLSSGTLYWTLNQVSGTINASDFTGGVTSGSFAVSGGAGSVTLTLANDATTEGTESFQFVVRQGSTLGTIIATSSTVTINDTSLSPTVTITPSAANVNEGGSVVFTVNTTNFPSGSLNFDTVLSADMEASDIDVTSGTVTISGSTGSIAITATADGYTETGQTESFQVRVYHPDGIQILATSSVVTINDTSTGTPEPSQIDITSAFYEISNRHIDSDIYMGGANDYNGPYDVGEVATNFNGIGRVYIGHKVTAQSSTFYSDAPIAGIQILNSSGTTLLASWIFNTSTGGSGSGWQTNTAGVTGSSTQGFPVTPATASGYTYSTITTTTGTNQFTWATSTASSFTGAAGGIGNTYKLTADGGSNTLAPVGDAQISQTASTYYAFRETSGSTLWSGAVMRSPTFTFNGGERIRVIHALTGYSVDPQNPNDSLYVAVI